MFELLEKLRHESVAKRKRVALFSALSIALVIFAMWLTVVYPDISFRSEQTAKATAGEPSPASALGETLGSGFDRIGKQFGAIKDTFSAFTTAPVQYVATSTDSTE